MSKLLGIDQTLEAVEALKGAARDFSSRSTKLAEELRVRLAKASNRKQTSAEELTNSLNTALAQEDAKFQAAMAEIQSNYEKRKVRLGKAYRTSKERGLAKVEEQIGNRKYTLQRQVLQAERDRDAGVAKATAELNQYRDELAKELNGLNELIAGARNSFKGYSKWLRLLPAEPEQTSEPVRDEYQALAECRGAIQEARNGLEKFKTFFLIKLFRFPILWVVLLACVAAAVPVLQKFGIRPPGNQPVLIYVAAVVLIAAVFLLRLFAVNKANSLVASLAGGLIKARHLHHLGDQRADAHYQEEVTRIHAEFNAATIEADQELKQALAGGTDLRARSRTNTDDKTFRITAKQEQLHKSKLERLQEQHKETLRRLNSEATEAEKAQTEAATKDEKRFKEEYRVQSEAFEAEWKTLSGALLEKISASRATAETLFPPWDSSLVEKWTPPSRFEHAARLGNIKIDLELSDSSVISAPLCLTYPDQGSVIFETGSSGREQAVGSLNNLIMRLLSVSPPGRLNFTIFDPIKLGQNFAGVMHLADYEEQLINNRIWTQSSQIEQRLADLNEHMEKVSRCICAMNTPLLLNTTSRPV